MILANDTHGKKWTDSDWLRTVQFKCNTSALFWIKISWKNSSKFSKPMISSEIVKNILRRNFGKC